MTPRGMTPHAGGGGAMTPGSTVRDNLNINREEAFMEDQQSMKHQQMEMKSQLENRNAEIPEIVSFLIISKDFLSNFNIWQYIDFKHIK